LTRAGALALLVFVFLLFLGPLSAGLWPSAAHAGPPYATDDPEPIPYHHWEIYLASQHNVTRAGATGVAPFAELNFGATSDLQLHVLAPLAYDRPSGGGGSYGPGDVEVGAKIRFVQEGEAVPMIGTYPMFELPVGDATKGLGTGRLHVFVPLWLQKSFGPWTTYGGPGYWVNPGPGNRDYWFFGALLQRRLSQLAAVGVELFDTTADRVRGRNTLRFNLGVVLDVTEHHHGLFSAGRSLVGDTIFQAYVGYLLTF
jgi:hypothetical protein